MSNVAVILLGATQLRFSKLPLNLLLAFLQMAAQAFPGSWAQIPPWYAEERVLWSLSSSCPDAAMNHCVHHLKSGCEAWHILASCIAEIPDVLLEFTTERSHMLLLEVLCSSKGWICQAHVRVWREAEADFLHLAKSCPKKEAHLKRTGKLNSCDWYRGKKYGYNQLGTTMFVLAAAAGLQ